MPGDFNWPKWPHPYSAERKFDDSGDPKAAKFTAYGAPICDEDFIEILLSENRRIGSIMTYYASEFYKMQDQLKAAQQQMEKKVTTKRIKPNLHLVKDGDGSEPPKSSNWLADLPVGTVIAVRHNKHRWGRDLEIISVIFQGKRITKLEIRKEDSQWSDYILWVVSEEYSQDYENFETLITPAPEELEVASPEANFCDPNGDRKD